ncbi:hypothetical protein COV06_03960 [Candidatus Uhrbacteria bacterium CG10_big_fil_rev_8_21_14_0_10_50_16]|uniref:AI-2E family transporter n=1 Tax=Candidatus Uhrbacteria bacterium CG10_big_fil_rev_8_21_14_0_10_50_16 TaxID=1975039 RepID=A0A2H0RLK8_9BACT|nr:MAG: hypothetical protein COV06_03960 [Candidatus Uhrbacteria bacterium CG10_big_fil_rev_8_21_14_0_10_50_16]
MAHTNKPTNISISTSTIVKVLLILGGIALLWFIRDILVIFFVALLLAALIDPFASWFVEHKIPRSIGVLVVYVALAAIVTLSLVIIIPPFVQQLAGLGASLAASFGDARGAIDSLVTFSEQYGLSNNLIESFSSVQQGFTEGLTRVFSTVAGIFGGIATLILVLVIAFYMVVEEQDGKRLFKHLAPKQYQPYLIGLAGRMQEKLGHWLRGQLILMVFIGVLTYVGLLILGVDYALVLGIFAGIAEIVPYAGPIISAVPAIIVAFTISPVKALIVAALYFAIQQLENGLLAPKIMQKSVGINPVASVFALMVGFEVGGIIGALLAMPVATILAVLVSDLLGEYDVRLNKRSSR